MSNNISTVITLRKFIFNNVSVNHIIDKMVDEKNGSVSRADIQHGKSYGYIKVSNIDKDELNDIISKTICDTFKDIPDNKGILKELKLSNDQARKLIKSADINLLIRVEESLTEKGNNKDHKVYYIEEVCR